MWGEQSSQDDWSILLLHVFLLFIVFLFLFYLWWLRLYLGLGWCWIDVFLATLEKLVCECGLTFHVVFFCHINGACAGWHNSGGRVAFLEQVSFILNDGVVQNVPSELGIWSVIMHSVMMYNPTLQVIDLTSLEGGPCRDWLGRARAEIWVPGSCPTG